MTANERFAWGNFTLSTVDKSPERPSKPSRVRAEYRARDWDAIDPVLIAEYERCVSTEKLAKKLGIPRQQMMTRASTRLGLKRPTVSVCIKTINKLLDKGMTNKAISEKLGVSAATIGNYIRREKEAKS